MIKDYELLVKEIVFFMQKQASEAGTKRAEVDISGGVDSAVVAALACKAFGPENVIGVYSDINSSDESRTLAHAVANKFGFKLVDLDLAEEFNSIVCKVHREFDRLGISNKDRNFHATVEGGFRSCIRAPVGRFVNRLFGGGIRQGTGNRDEDDLLRFYQKGGDGEVDCNWIGGLFKGEVWELAEYLEVPCDVIDAKPTPDLWGTGSVHNDEDELEDITGVKLTYTRPGQPMGTIEWVIRENDKHGIINGYNCERKADIKDVYTPEQWEIIDAVRKMEKATRHKAEPPPSISRQYLVDVGAVE
jgi:NAD+ synthetase